MATRDGQPTADEPELREYTDGPAEAATEATLELNDADDKKVAVAKIGQVENFDSSLGSMSPYEERLMWVLKVNRVPYARKVDAFLSLIRPTTYNLLKSLIAPALPVAELTKLLQDHLEPKPSVISERVRFHRHVLSADYVALTFNESSWMKVRCLNSRKRLNKPQRRTPQ